MKGDFKWFRNPKDVFLVEFKTGAIVTRYTTSNLIKFVDFLNAKFPGWRYMNVYHRIPSQRLYCQIASYTPNWLPTAPLVTEKELNRYLRLAQKNRYDLSKIVVNSYRENYL
jgi:hypothetical protein